MKRSAILRRLFEATAVLVCMVFIPLLPRRAVVAMANALGTIGWKFSQRDRRITLANLEVAFPGGLTDEDKARIGRASFQSFSLMLLDLFWFGFWTRRRLACWVKLDDSFRPAFSTKPLVFVTAHLGNWEVLGQAFAMNGEGLLSAAAELDNPMVNRLLNRMRNRTGQVIVEKTGVIKHMIKALKNGGRVALVADQNVVPGEGGEFVSLFGLPAPMSRMISGLCRYANGMMMFTWCVADAQGRYTAYGLPPENMTNRPETEVTRRMVEMLELVIRRHPGNWLWSYKRWKFFPAGADSSRYPYYARVYDGGK